MKSLCSPSILEPNPAKEFIKNYLPQRPPCSLSVNMSKQILSTNPAVKEKQNLNSITESIIDAAIEIHKTLGPGLLESTYEACMAFELSQRNLKIETQKALPVIYKQVKLDAGYRLDLLVNQEVIVEIKAVDQLNPVHKAQLLSYLKLSGCKVGLLINFNTKLLKDQLIRIVNNFPD